MSASPRTALGAAAFASGLAALTYQILWIRWIGELCGATAVAVAIVLGTFFAGLGIGAWILGRAADRFAPARLFALLEAGIAVHAIVLTLGYDAITRLVDAGLRADPSRAESWTLAAVVGAALLLPPSIAMGGTLPALVKLAARAGTGGARALGWIYAANTLGAAAGALSVAHVFLPRLGTDGSVAAGAIANAVAAALALLVARGAAREHAAADFSADSPIETRARGRVAALAFVSGFVTIGLEVAWTRALSGRSQGTVYSYAGISAVYLACLALPALLLGAADRRGWIGARSIAFALAAGGALAVASLHALARVAPAETAGAAWISELGSAALVTGPSALALAVVFPMTMHLAVRTREHASRDLGRSLAANTIGAVIAAPIVTFLALPHLGQRGSIGALALIACATAIATVDRARRGIVATAGLGALLLAWFTGPDDVRPWRGAPGDRLVAYREGVLGSVAIVREASGDQVLKLGAVYRLGSESTAFAQQRQGLLPYAARASGSGPMLFLGLGTGSSVGAVADAGDVTIEVAEIVPELTWAVSAFARANHDLAARLRRGDPHLRILPVDARAYARAKHGLYATIVGDLFVPWRAGEGSMYTREHFRAVRGALAKGGRFYQWLPLYQLSTEDLKVIVATFLDVFPSVDCAWLYWNAEQAAIALIGSYAPWSVDERADGGRAAEVLADAGLGNRASIAALWIADRTALETFAAGAPIETRARPVVEFDAPRRRPASQSDASIANVQALASLAQPMPVDRLLPGASEAERRESSAQHDASRPYFAARAALHAGRTREALERLGEAALLAPDWEWVAWNVDQIVLAAWKSNDTATVEHGARILRTTTAGRAAACWHEGRLRLVAGDAAGAAKLAEEGLAHDAAHAGCKELLARARAAR